MPVRLVSLFQFRLPKISCEGRPSEQPSLTSGGVSRASTHPVKSQDYGPSKPSGRCMIVVDHQSHVIRITKGNTNWWGEITCQVLKRTASPSCCLLDVVEDDLRSTVDLPVLLSLVQRSDFLALEPVSMNPGSTKLESACNRWCYLSQT